VLLLGLVVVALARRDRREPLRAANPLLLLCVLVIATGLGTLARSVGGVGRLTAHTGRWQSARLGAGAALSSTTFPPR
jgi:hypothetical protein